MSEQKIPKWIKKHEEDSWKSELFISGGAIFTLFQVPGIIETYLPRIITISDFEMGTGIGIIGVAIVSRVLLFGFILNLIIRAIWVALLAIHQMFPDGPDFKKLGYHKSFENNFSSEGGQISKIIQLENLAGLSFALSVFLAMICIPGLFLLFILFNWVYPLIIPDEILESTLFVLFNFLIYFISTLGFFEFLAYRLGRKHLLFNKIFSPIARLFSWINSTRLFYWELYSVFSKYGKLKIALVFIVIVFTAILSIVNEIRYISPEGLELNVVDERRFFNDESLPVIYAQDYSADNPELKNYYSASIPNEVVKDEYIPVFVTYDKLMDATFERVLDSLNLKGLEAYDHRQKKSIVQMMDNCIKIKIDGQTQSDLKWYRTSDVNTGIDGFKAYVPIDKIQNGEHEMRVLFLKSKHESISDEKDFVNISTLFFYKHI